MTTSNRHYSPCNNISMSLQNCRTLIMVRLDELVFQGGDILNSLVFKSSET